jgi:hypothetical protein
MFLQDALGLQPPQVTGEITQDKAHDGFTATVSIIHSGRAASAPVFERTLLHHDPESLITDMAQGALELIDPYILACRADDNQDRKQMMHFISECDGKFAKWGWNLWGNALEDEKQFDRAIDKFKKAIEEIPNSQTHTPTGAMPSAISLIPTMPALSRNTRRR